jgi:hypothetical protein
MASRGTLLAISSGPLARPGAKAVDGEDSAMSGASRRRLTVIAVLAVGTWFLGTAGAQECPSACGLQKRACIQGARTHKLACKMDCRSTGDRTGLGECVRGCMATFRLDKVGCNADRGSCVESCGPGGPPAPPICRMMCGHDFVTCAQGAMADVRGCAHACPTGRDHHECAGACTASARDAASACAAAFRTCAAGCGGSPSGAYL